MSVIKGREIPLVIAFVTAILGSVGYFIAVPAIQAGISTVEGWAVTIAAFALGLGAINMIFYNAKLISKRTPGRWYYSIITLASMILMFSVGYATSLEHPAFEWLYTNVYRALYSTMLSTLGFFVVSAVYRSFKTRNVDASILLISAFLVLLKNAPIGGAIWPGFEIIGAWFMDYLGNAGMRGYYISIGIGVVAFGIRAVLGYERGWLGRED